MEIIRNLGGVQKGLLGGLILGILLVYLCLCVSATGIVPLAPKPSSLQTGAQAAVITAVVAANGGITPTVPAVVVAANSVTPTVPAAAPTDTAQPTVAPTATLVPTEAPATETATLEPTLTPTDLPTVEFSTATVAPVPVALVVEQATAPAQPPVRPVHKPPVAPAAAVQPAAAVVTPTPEWAWRGIEYERIPGNKSGNPAAVLAVRIVGVPDRKVFVQEVSGGLSTTLVTGRKLQYGDFADEIGGITPGTYLIKPMDIDSTVQVNINPGDFVLIEFALRPPANWTPEPPALAQTTAAAPATAIPAAPVKAATAPATAPAAPAVTAPTAVPDWAWQGIEFQRIPGTQSHNVFATIAVRVVGVPNRNVFINEVSGGFKTTLVTGKKPDYGDFSDDAGGLEPGTYVIKPMDIDNQVSVQISAGDFVLVEFALRPTHPLTGTPGAAAVQPAATVKAVPATAVSPKPIGPTTAPATVAPAPPAAAAGDWTWQGIEFQRIPGTKTGNAAGVLAVRVVGVPDRKIQVRESSGGWSTTLVTGKKPQYGEFSDDVGGLPAGIYFIKPMDINNEVQVNLGTGDFVLIEFALRPAKVLTPSGAAPAATTTGSPATQPQKSGAVN